MIAGGLKVCADGADVLLSVCPRVAVATVCVTLGDLSCELHYTNNLFYTKVFFYYYYELFICQT